MSDSQQPEPRRRRIEPWAVWPLVFFALLIGVHLVLIARMTRTDVSTVEPDAYRRSGEYDADLAAISRFEDLGLRLEAEPGVDNAVSISVGGDATTLRDATLEFYRPDSAALDQSVAWDDPVSPLHLALPRSGVWRVTLIATVDGEPVRAATRLTL